MRRLAAIFALVLTLGAAGFPADPAAPEPFLWPLPAWAPPPPVPKDNPMSAAKVELGRRLFYDARLSRDGTIACASCHAQALAFSDGRPVSVGIEGGESLRNAPSLANAGYLPKLTWSNPQIGNLEFQALIPIFGEDPEEMGSNGREDRIFARLGADPAYAKAFPEAFPERPEIDLFTITRALGAFQRTLISLNSPYDRFKYWGEPEALSDSAKRGEQLFFDHRFECYHCHSGLNLTDNLQTARSPFAESGFHNTGLYDLDGEGAYPPRASGLQEFTGAAADMGKFRTPSLRNVAVTAPYFHDGSAATLEEALAHYAAGGRTIAEGPRAGDGARNPYKDPLILGFTASEAEIQDLVAFLESLTDERFLTDAALADPWPEGHPAVKDRISP